MLDIFFEGDVIANSNFVKFELSIVVLKKFPIVTKIPIKLTPGNSMFVSSIDISIYSVNATPHHFYIKYSKLIIKGHLTNWVSLELFLTNS